MLIAIVLGIAIGSLTGTNAELFGITYYSAYDLIGKLFIQALTLIVVPLVSSSIITGIARIGSDSSFGRLGLKIFSFYIGTSLIAILIGLLFVNFVAPGSFYASHAPAISENESILRIEEMAQQKSLTLVGIILQVVPSNVVDAFHGQMIGLIFFSLLFGYALQR